MGLTEIILLMAGCVIFIVSFVLPEKKRGISKEDIELGEEQVKKLVEQEMQDAKSRISEMVDETVSYGVEKTERSLDRLSNEKIMAVNEYSDTVLESINNNHKEVMFLYDMLNNKQESLKETVREANMAERKMKVAAESVEDLLNAVPEKTVSITQVIPEEVKEDFAKEILQENAEAEQELKSQDVTAQSDEVAPKKKRKTTKKPAKVESQVSFNVADKTAVDINFTADEDNGRNNNEKILALHKAGKSNMVIAKELGLGIGEVKLVIDLFEGM